MAEVVQKDIESLVSYLPNQYTKSPNIQTFLSIFLEQVQELEDANITLDEVSTDIAIAYGYQLDIIGKLIGVDRQGRTDEDYREAIYLQISINIGSGTPENVIQYLASITKASKVGYWEHYPASIILETNGSVIPSNIAETVDTVSLAGVSVGGVIVVPDNGQVFRGCNVTDVFGNFEQVNNPYPEIECGGDGTECGSPLNAECTYNSFNGYLPVSDEDPLSRCILPNVGDTGTTKGILPNIYIRE